MLETDGGLQPRTLEDLQQAIEERHDKYVKLSRNALGHARHAGILLMKAKEMVEAKSLGWEKWVGDNCSFAVDTANRYISLANHWSRVREKFPDLSSVSITAALRAIKGKPVAKEPPATLVVSSEKDVSVAQEVASGWRPAEGSVLKRAVARQVDTIRRQILSLVRDGKVTDDRGQALPPAAAALAVLYALKQELGTNLVLEVKTTTAITASGEAVRPHNRLTNGAPTPVAV